MACTALSINPSIGAASLRFGQRANVAAFPSMNNSSGAGT